MRIADLTVRAFIGAAIAAAAIGSAVAQGSYSGSGAQPVTRGGTGRSVLDANTLIFGGGTDPVKLVACTGALFGTGVDAPPACRPITGNDLPANVKAISSAATAANKLGYWTGAGVYGLTDFSAFARALVAGADAPTMRTTLGAAIGIDVQAYNANLAAVSAAATAADKLGYWTGTGAHALTDFTPFARSLIAGADAAAMRSTLGLAPVAASGSASDLATGTLPPARMPNPSASSLGGIQSLAAVAKRWINAISTSGVPITAQPACADMSDAAPSCATDTTTQANVTFTGLAAASAAADADVVAVNQGGGNLKQSFAAIKAWVKGWISKTDVGLGNVDNTSDSSKWSAVKTLTNTMFDTAGTGNGLSIAGVVANSNTGTGAIARAASPVFTDPTANTQPPSNNSAKLATTAYVDAQVAGSVSGVSSLNGQTGILAMIPAPQVRLTLTSGVAVTVSDVTGVTSIYATPVGGNQVPIYDGARLVPRTFGEIALALDNNASHAGYQQSGKNFDTFLYWTGSAVGFGTGPSWNSGAVAGSDVARGTGAGSTETQWIGGIPTNKNSITLRVGANNGDTVVVAANQATLIGSFRATADGQATDSKTRRLVSNVFNLVVRKFNEVPDPLYTWNYNLSTWRVANANAATKAEILQSLDGNPVHIRLKSASTTSGSGLPVVGIGVSLDGVAPTLSAQSPYIAGVGWQNLAFCFYDDYPGLGFHTFAPWEKAAGDGNNQSFVGETVARMIGKIWN